MADKTCQVNGGVWETGATWSGGVPGVNDRAIIPDATHVPLAPVGATTIHDITITDGALDASANLTISHTIIATNSQLNVKAQSTAGQAITLVSCLFVVTNDVAGDITADTGSTITATNFNGLVNAADITVLVGGKLNGATTVPGRLNYALKTMEFGSSASVHFTGSNPAFLSAADSGSAGPATIIADADLVIYPPTVGSDFNLTGVSITVAGNCTVLPDFLFSGTAVGLDGATITGSFTPGKFFTQYAATGTFTVTGFEPLYKEGGSGGTTKDSYGSGGVIILPAKADVKSGVTYGPPDNEQLGELASGGGGRGGMGLSL